MPKIISVGEFLASKGEFGGNRFLDHGSLAEFTTTLMALDGGKNVRCYVEIDPSGHGDVLHVAVQKITPELVVLLCKQNCDDFDSLPVPDIPGIKEGTIPTAIFRLWWD